MLESGDSILDEPNMKEDQMDIKAYSNRVHHSLYDDQDYCSEATQGILVDERIRKQLNEYEQVTDQAD